MYRPMNCATRENIRFKVEGEFRLGKNGDVVDDTRRRGMSDDPSYRRGASIFQRGGFSRARPRAKEIVAIARELGSDIKLKRTGGRYLEARRRSGRAGYALCRSSRKRAASAP